MATAAAAAAKAKFFADALPLYPEFTVHLLPETPGIVYWVLSNSASGVATSKSVVAALAHEDLCREFHAIETFATMPYYDKNKVPRGRAPSVALVCDPCVWPSCVTLSRSCC